MQIQFIELEKIKEYENNPRFNDDAVDAVASSISEFGFKVPVIIDKDYVIVTGHTRCKAAKKLGLSEVPCIIADDLTDDQLKAFRLADNKVGEIAEWDFDKLQVELDGIDLDMSAFGFDFEEESPEAHEDLYDGDIPAEPKSKYGDIYELGRHRLMCGDSTLEKDVQALTDGEMMDLCITDPPYNVNYTQKKNHGEDIIQIQNDNMDDSSFFNFLLDVYIQMLSVLRVGGAYYIWHADSEGLNFRAALKSAGGQVKQTIIWVKNSLVLGRQDYQWQHEPCLYGWKEGAGHYFTPERHHTTVYDRVADLEKLKKDELLHILKNAIVENETSIIRENKPARNDLHPTMKPVLLIAHLLNNSSQQGDRVIDFFGGSGSTLIACEQLNRTCFSMELDPKYVDVIINRWEKETGQKANFIKNIYQEENENV